MKLLTDLWTSRKAQTFAVIVVVALFGEAANISADQVTLIVEGGIAFILGRAIHDHAIAKDSAK
mgnify:CR=1 FL=1